MLYAMTTNLLQNGREATPDTTQQLLFGLSADNNKTLALKLSWITLI